MEKKRALRAGAVLLAAAVVLMGIYWLRPPCLILKYTGFTCAGCGTQRMVTALLHGDMAGAWGHNPFMFVCLPAAALYALWEAHRYVRGKRPLYRTKAAPIILIAVLFAALVFAVLRNLQH